MDGVVVIAGRFQAGSVVKLYRVQDDAVFRSEGGELVGERLVDADGNVGFDQLEIGAPHIAAGYVDGGFLEFRCRPADVSQPSDFSQPPTPPATAAIGTQGAPDVEVPPAPPVVEEGDEPLPVGVPEGVPIETGTHTYYLHIASGEVEPVFELAGVQAPAETAADGTVIDARPLYDYVGARDADEGVPEGWEAYEGPTEVAGTTPAQSTFTDVSGSEPTASGDTTPPAPDVPAADVPADSEVTVSAPSPVTVETTPDVTVQEPAPVAEGDSSSPAPTDGGDAPVSPDEPAQSEATDGGAQAAAPSESAPAADAPASGEAESAATPEAAAPEAPVEAEAPAVADAPVAPAEDAPAPDAPPADAPAEAPAPAPVDAPATDAPPAQEGA